MRARAEAVSFIRKQFDQIGCWKGTQTLWKVGGEEYDKTQTLRHYGLVELRDLMDFIYGGPPIGPEEELVI